MAGNLFNPGFDREKKAFIDLANRGDGLTPINYLFADEANFESVLASYVTGGTFDIGMMYVINIDAKTILTNIIDADIAYIDIAYMRQLHINEIFVDYVLVTEAYVEKKFGVGVRNGKDWPSDQNPQARFYTNQFIVDGSSFNSSAASFDLESSFLVHSETTTMTSDALTSLAAGGIFNISSGLATTIDAGGAILLAAGAYITMNTFGNVTINPNAAFTPCGAVSIYSQNLVEMSAPNLKLGIFDVNMGLAITNEILMDSIDLIKARTTDFTVETSNKIKLDASHDIEILSFENMDITAYDKMKITSFKEIAVLAFDLLNLQSDIVNIVGNKKITMKCPEFVAELGNEATIITKDLEITTYDKLNVKATYAKIDIDVSKGSLYFNTEEYGGELLAYFDNIYIAGQNKVDVFCKKKLTLVAHEDMYIGSIKKISLKNTESSIVLDQKIIDIKTDKFNIELRNELSVQADEVHFTGGNVIIFEDLDVEGTITFNHTTFKSYDATARTWVWYSQIPTPKFILSQGNLVSDTGPVVGVIEFTIPNVMTCENEVVSVKNVTVTINIV